MFGAVALIKLHKCQFEDDECKAHPRKDTIPRKQNVDLPWEFAKIGAFMELVKFTVEVDLGQ